MERATTPKETRRLAHVDKAVATYRHYSKRARRELDEMANVVEQSDGRKIFIGAQTALLNAGDTMADSIIVEGRNNLGVLPPQALDMERAVLGAILLESSGMPKVESYLEDDHFYQERHKIVYRACIALRKEGKPIDMRTIVFKLREEGQIEVIGGAFYIADLTSKVSSTASIEFHARVMIEMAIKRRLIMCCSSIFRDAYQDGTDCFELLEFAEGEFKKIRSWIK